MISIAVDAMGGDYAPLEIIAGAVQGARSYNVKVLLVGLKKVIQGELSKIDTSDVDLEIIDASQVISMNEAASQLRKKSDASIVVAAKCVKNGQANALVAAGSTGAAMASSLLYIGRIQGIERPAIGVVLPSSTESPCLLLDAGANADCTVDMLSQFAIMGQVFMRNVYNVPTPRVGLLNIGEEPGKGNELALEAYKALEKDNRISFVGNIEGKELFMGGADVAVTDGFSGNIALKSAEGVMKMFRQVMKTEFEKHLQTKIGFLLSKPALKAASHYVDPEEFGGALLLGIKGICVISHGGSRARGIKNAIRVAKNGVETQVVEKITGELISAVH